MSGPRRASARVCSSSTGPFQSTASTRPPRNTSHGVPRDVWPRGRTVQRPEMRRCERTTMPPSNRSTRFLPCAVTDTSVRPSIRSATRSARARGCGELASICSPTSTCSRAAVLWMVSPSGTAPGTVTADLRDEQRPRSSSRSRSRPRLGRARAARQAALPPRLLGRGAAREARHAIALVAGGRARTPCSERRRVRRGVRPGAPPDAAPSRGGLRCRSHWSRTSRRFRSPPSSSAGIRPPASRESQRSGARRGFAQATVRHGLFGVVLGRLAQ